MKKLLIITAVSMLAGVLQAATVNWNVEWRSGWLDAAAGENGGWSGTVLSSGQMAPGTSLAVSVYLVSQTDYTTAQSLSQKELYAEYTNGTHAQANAPTTASSGFITATTTVEGADAPAPTYYAVVIYTYTDATLGEMYMAATADTATAGLDLTNPDNTYAVAGIGSSVEGGWQAVPEPTSGLLLLVGGALLALKRKRA